MWLEAAGPNVRRGWKPAISLTKLSPAEVAGWRASVFEGREWFAVPAAPREMLDELRQVAPVELPASYYQLLAFSDGGEGPLPLNPFNLCLDASNQVTEAIRTKNYGQPDLAGFIVFGGNGGGELLAFDVRGAAPWPIVTIDLVVGAASAEQVAPDFDAFMELIGRE
jgi:hypothetical protein